MGPSSYIWSCCEIGSASPLLNGACSGDVTDVTAALNKDPLLVLHKGIGGLRDTAWHLAAANGHEEVLAALHHHLEAHLPLITKELTHRLRPPHPFTPEQAMTRAVNLLNVKGQTPLMFACFAGKTECVAQLMGMGADPWVADFCGRRTALHYAALHGHNACIAAVLDMTPASMLSRQVPRQRSRTMHMLVNQVTVSGFTPLHYAAHSRKPGAITTLLEHNANMLALSTADGVYDIITSPRWTTPLHVAALIGFEEGAREMLRHYLACRDSGRFRDPRLSTDRAYRLPHHVASLHGHTQLAELLHPRLNLDNVFPNFEVERRGVPKLSLIATSVLKQELLALVDSADAKISQLPSLDNPGTLANMRKGLSGTSRPPLCSLPGRNSNAANPLDTVEEIDYGTANGSRTSARGAPAAGPAVAPAAMQDGPSRQRSVLPRLLASLSRPWGGSDDDNTPNGTVDGRGGSLRGSTSRRGGSITGGSPDVEPVWWGAGGSLTGSRTRQGGGSPEPEPDWWAAASVALANPPAMIGAPAPGDRTASSMLRPPSLMERVRSIGKSKSKPPNDAGPSQQPAENGQNSGPRGTASGASVRGRGGLPLSPFAAISWGTSEMVAALPSVDTCTVCLDDVYALVLVPCLHRLCAPCARRMVIAITDKPFDCPVCRTHVRASFAPHDTQALENALDLYQQK